MALSSDTSPDDAQEILRAIEFGVLFGVVESVLDQEHADVKVEGKPSLFEIACGSNIGVFNRVREYCRTASFSAQAGATMHKGEVRDPMLSLVDRAQRYEASGYPSTNGTSTQTQHAKVLSQVSIVGDYGEKKGLSYMPYVPMGFDMFDTILPQQKNAPSHSSLSYDDLHEQYREAMETVCAQVASGASYSLTLSLILHVMKRYLWCVGVPSVPDLSLYEHAISTASIASCLYRYLVEEKGGVTPESVSTLDTEDATGEKPFLLALGTFSGIQSYVFDIQKHASATKRLKGRSFLVQFISEDVRERLSANLSLTPMHTIVNAAGNFVLLLPNTKHARDEFEKTRAEVTDGVFKRYSGELRYNLALSDPFSGVKFGAQKGVGEKNFGNYFDDLYVRLAEEKHHPFRSALCKDSETVWKEQAFVVSALPDDREERTSLCPFCKKYVVDPTRKKDALYATGDGEEVVGMCTQCADEVVIGKYLRKEPVAIFWYTDGFAPSDSIPLLFGSISIVNKDAYDVGISIAEQPDRVTILEQGGVSVVDSVSLLRTVRSVESRPYATRVPIREGVLDSERLPWVKDFDEICADETDKRGEGLAKLAILKGDVDNLGAIVAFGLRHLRDTTKDAYTATRIRTLSLHLGLFFEGYVHYLAETEFPDLYVVFSGGDDFTIIGYWESLIDFAARLQRDLAIFAGNNDEVHFSAAVHLIGHKWPVYEEIHKAEEMLKIAKGGDKNSISLMGSVLTWEEFHTMRTHVDELEKVYGEDGFSMGYLYLLLDIALMKRLADETKDAGAYHLTMRRAYLHYHTYRRLKDRALQTVLKLFIEGDMPPALANLESLATYLLYKKRSVHD